MYVASSENHLIVTDDRRFSHDEGVRVHGLRSAANPLFESASRVFRDPATAEDTGMPQSAIDTGVVDYVLPLPPIPAMRVELVRGVAPAAA